MRIKGKIFGAGTGLLFGGLPGAIIGGIVGHLFDSLHADSGSGELEALKEMVFWAAKASSLDDRFMFSKREYVRNNIISGIPEEQQLSLLKSFDRHINNENIKMVSISRNISGENRYVKFRLIYNLMSIGGMNVSKRKYLESIVKRFGLSEKEFHSIDKEFQEKSESMNEDIGSAIDMLRLPIFFEQKDLLNQYRILKDDFRDNSEKLDKAFIKLDNYLKEA
ncbi:MAG: hypothetical protein GWP03_02990 [Proteobacteria bacterium]|nr:hypothetical protein [Pseudomonadota bacterium]